MNTIWELKKYQGSMNHTFLSRIHQCSGTERAFSFVIEDTHFNLKGRERAHALIPEYISGSIRGSQHCQHPDHFAMWPEGYHITKASAIL